MPTICVKGIAPTEARCRRRTVETDEEIQQAKEGKFRRLSKSDVEDLAAQWCIDFQLINRENIAREAFPDVLGKPDPLGDEAKTPIILNRPLFAEDPEVRMLGYGKEQMWK